jgi:hypothetical protein
MADADEDVTIDDMTEQLDAEASRYERECVCVCVCVFECV